MPRVSLPAAPASRRKQVEKPGVAQRQAPGLEDLVGVQGGERDLRGADQEELVVGHLVDHLALAGKKPVP